jgi:hypothetical protein
MPFGATEVADNHHILPLRFGFAGESGPRCIVRTEVKCPETKQVKKVLNYSSKDELYDLLVEFIHTLYFRYTNAWLCLGFYCLIFKQL